MAINYIPVLNVRPSEILAFTEVPDVAKDRMLPLFQLRPWLGRPNLQRVIDRIDQAVGNRKWIAALDFDYLAEDQDALREMELLKDPTGYFSNWRNFVSGLRNAIPTPTLTEDFESFRNQVLSMQALGRGIALRFDRSRAIYLKEYLIELNKIGLSDPIVILDYGQNDSRILHEILKAVSDCKLVMELLPDVRLAVSATTFPSQFEGAENEAIYERSFYANVAQGIPSNTLIYSDHGSTRLHDDERRGGVPRPRIDVPRDDAWHFFRSDLVREKKMSAEEYLPLKDAAYREMADRAVKSRSWDPNLNIWGTQFIKITQLGSEFGINSAAKATACRINIHLTRQALYGSELTSTEFEEDWHD